MQSFGVPNKIKQDPLVNANKVSGSEINIQGRINAKLQQQKKKKKKLVPKPCCGIKYLKALALKLVPCNLRDVALESAESLCFHWNLQNLYVFCADFGRKYLDKFGFKPWCFLRMCPCAIQANAPP